MKPRLILFALIGLILAGGLLLVLRRPVPSIRFLGFHAEKHGKMASFQISNDTGEPYSFSGYGTNSPLYSYKIEEALGWKVHHLGWCGTGAGLHTVAPHGVTDIEVPVPRDAPSSPFKVGVYLLRGTPGQLSARRPRPNFISELLTYLRQKIQPDFEGPEPTWSDTARP